MSEEEKYNIIESYLEGSLSGEALLSFEKQLARNKNLRQELQLHQDLSRTLSNSDTLKFMDLLDKVDQEWEFKNQKEKKARLVILRPIIKYATAIAACTIIGLFLFTGVFSSTSSDDLYATYHQPYTMILADRSANLDQQHIEHKISGAILAYNQEQYANAALQFEKLHQTFPEKAIYQFYQAQSLLANQQAADAIPLFQNLTQDSILREQINWYLSLAYVQNKDGESAKTQLQLIQKGELRYEEAQVILRNL